jgi:hypothetical protein
MFFFTGHLSSPKTDPTTQGSAWVWASRLGPQSRSPDPGRGGLDVLVLMPALLLAQQMDRLL